MKAVQEYRQIVIISIKKMTANQEDKLSMQIVVVNLIKNTQPSILAKMPHFNTINAAFSENVDKLRAYKTGQNLNRTGNSMSKAQLREQMTQYGFVTAAKVCAYALSIDDEVLEMQVTYTNSDFKHLRETHIADTCQSILEIAQANLANLTDYGVTTASLLQLSNSIALYNQILPKTRAGIVAQTIFTDKIVKTFEENEKLLFRMNKLVTILKYEEATFYEEYFKSRKIINTGHRKLALKGKITNELGQPIDNVTITIETPTPETTKSTDHGNYQFKSSIGGVFPVTFKRDGYLTERQFLVFTPNARLDFNITLKQAQEQQNSA